MSIYTHLDESVIKHSHGIFAEGKYLNWYFSIIDNALSRGPRKPSRKSDNYVYYEAHHILPGSIFPQFYAFRPNPWNKVLLTAKEHYIVHRILAKICIRKEHQNSMYWAISNMRANKTGERFFRSAHYAHIREVISKLASENMKGVPKTLEQVAKMKATKALNPAIGEDNPNWGRKWAPEKRERMSKQRKGKPQHPNTRAAWDKMLSESHPTRGRKRTPEERKKMSDSAKLNAIKNGGYQTGKKVYHDPLTKKTLWVPLGGTVPEGFIRGLPKG